MAVICYLLSSRGFCSGVTRAVNMVEQVLKLYGTVYVIEDVIHNKMFMKDLSTRGVIKVESIEEIPDASVVMFSAHGVSPEIIDKAEKKELTIIDGTCPIVKSIQNAAKAAADSGKKIIIIGNRSHQEIIALLGCLNNKDAYVVYSEMDVDLLPDFSNDKVVYFTQTTLYSSCVQPLIEKLKSKIPHIESDSLHNICYATKERQEAVRKISNSVDLLLVVGSAHSSNANRLVEVALDSGAKNAIRIDSKDELDPEILKNVSSIAVTAAASTPEFLVEDLIRFLRDKLDLILENFESSEENECR